MEEIVAIINELQENNLHDFVLRINRVMNEMAVSKANKEAVLGMPIERNRLLRILPELWDFARRSHILPGKGIGSLFLRRARHILIQ